MATKLESRPEANQEPTYQIQVHAPGRPPKHPKDKINIPIRCLTTMRMARKIDQAAGAVRHTSLSNYLRLALYNQLKSDGLLVNEEDLKDATWNDLRLAGLV
jgi:hypothetical protein